MSATNAPYGLVPIEKQGGNPNQGGAQRAYAYSGANANPIAVGQLATLIAGVIAVPAAAPTAGQAIGVVSGVEFTDPVMKYPVQDSMLPTGAVAAGYTNIKIFINDDPNQFYKIQSSVAVAQAKVGTKVDITNNDQATPAVKRGNGAATASGTTLLIVGFFETPASKASDAYPELVVKIASPLHIYNA
jgi:hypothetical protein